MQSNCKALYNSLRINWLNNPDLNLEPWQVEDYRALSWDFLLERLKVHDIHMTKETFLSLASDYYTPEECADDLLADLDADQKTEDQIYLLVFEMWRRLLSDKPSLSIFCDELDYNITRFDEGDQSDEQLQDLLANLKEILDENVDDGTDPAEAYESLAECCANDLSSFLYDYISFYIANGNNPYASELIDNFYDYIPEVKWFDFLRAKVTATSDPDLANGMIRQTIKEWKSDNDLDFNFEVLEFLSQFGDSKLFHALTNETISLLETEEDFQDLIALCIRYFHFLDKESQEKQLEAMLKDRQKIDPDKLLEKTDPHLNQLLSLLEMKKN